MALISRVEIPCPDRRVFGVIKLGTMIMIIED